MRKSAVALFALLGLFTSFALGAASLPDFTGIVEKNSSAVVKILSESTGGDADSTLGMDPRYDQLPPLFRDFFFRGQPRNRPSRSMGSGFIISEDGYVLTNNHVVEGGDSITVRLDDRREYQAEVVGTDARSDLALLKIKEQHLPYLRLSNSDKLNVGEWVLAIGSPFGLDYSVSAGIVSAIGRSIPTEKGENYVPFIQTDVAINPGNSGGPLFNLAGEVVGINSQIYTRSGGSIGLSFAIPSSLAIEVVSQLKETGKVSRGWLGVSIQEVDRNLAESFGLDKPAGALISQLEIDGPADQAGIEVGDIIIEFNGEEIATSADLPHVVGLTKPGSTVTVKLIRERKTIDIKLKVGALEGDESPSLAGEPAPMGGRLGVTVDEVPERVARNWHLKGGVFIRDLDPSGPAAEAGLARGDVITQIGNNVIADVAEFNAVADELPTGTHIPVRFVRRGRSGFVAIRIED